MKGINWNGEQGTALVSVMGVVAALATLSLTMIERVESTTRKERGARELQAARYVTEAGLNAAFVDMRAGNPGDMGSEQDEVELGGGTFWVDVENLGGSDTRLVSTGTAQGQKVRSELIVREVETGVPSFGVFGDELLYIESNAFVDSYNSSLGPYATQAIFTDGNDVWASENGHIASNANIYVTQNGGVHGDATPGVTSTTTVSGNATVSGSTLSISTPFVMPTLEFPPGTPSGNLIVSGDQTLASGTYFLNDLTLNANSTLTVTGPVVFVVDDLQLKSNSELVIDTTAGGAEFYVRDDFILESNTLLAPLSLDPSQLSVSLKGNNVIDPTVDVEIDPDLEVGFKSNSQMYGTLFAPKAYIEIRSNFELFGALMARRLLISSNSMIHYDEHLGEVDEDTEINYEIVGWREVPIHD